MAEEITNPLLSLIKEQSLIDDLQFEEVQAEFKRSGKSVMQILQDMAIMDLDSILHVMGDYLGVPVIKLSSKELTPEIISAVPPASARMYQALPVGVEDGTLKVALVEPLNPGRVDELGFVVKKNIQLVIADPTDVQKAIERYYPEQGEDVSDILKQLGSDKEIEQEAAAAMDDA